MADSSLVSKMLKGTVLLQLIIMSKHSIICHIHVNERELYKEFSQKVTQVTTGSKQLKIGNYRQCNNYFYN